MLPPLHHAAPPHHPTLHPTPCYSDAPSPGPPYHATLHPLTGGPDAGGAGAARDGGQGCRAGGEAAAGRGQPARQGVRCLAQARQEGRAPAGHGPEPAALPAARHAGLEPRTSRAQAGLQPRTSREL
eukprot:scaffold42145_cov48-Phaeocystis_antarctica.AAC.4